jgi:two-component system response regulator RegX3
MHVCVLEDDATLNAQVCSLLTGLGHTTAAFTNGNDLIRALRVETFDLFVLDWHVPGATGFEVLETIRKVKQLTSPVLFLTSRTEEQDLVTVFQAGADDYCTKPVKPREFTVRVDALLRRSYPPVKQESKRNYYDYVFDINTQQVAFDGQVATLSEKEFKLAVFLFENFERAMARQRLLNEVWGGEGDALSRTLDVHISWLRKKLDLSATSKRLHLKAIHGYGYRLMAI